MGEGKLMKKETVQEIKKLAAHSSLGLTIAFSIFIGLFFGIFLDKKFDTGPVFMLIGLGLGIAAAFRNMLHAINKLKK